MKRVIVEYREDTGEIVCVRSFDCAEIPIQPCLAGHAMVHVDVSLEPALADAVRFRPQRYRVNHVTKDFEEKG